MLPYYLRLSDILLATAFFFIVIPFYEYNQILGIFLFLVLFSIIGVMIYRRMGKTQYNNTKSRFLGSILSKKPQTQPQTQNYIQEIKNKIQSNPEMSVNIKGVPDAGMSSTFKYLKTPDVMPSRQTTIKELKDHFPALTDINIIHNIILRLPQAMEYDVLCEPLIRDLRKFSEFLASDIPSINRQIQKRPRKKKKKSRR